MFTEINNSKEVIKNRMLKHALTYWGIKNTEDLDPAVKLILEALSLELYNLGNEIKDTQVRVLEKIANLLTPDFLTSPNPAHAVVHAAPVEPIETVDRDTSFFIQHKVSLKQNEMQDTTIEVFFTPVDTVRLFDATIAYLVTGGNVYACDASFNKQLTARSTKKQVENNTLWLGLKINPAIESIQHLVFCFDWKNLETKLAHHLFRLLPLTKWFIGGKEIETMQGIPYAASPGSNANEDIFADYDLLSLIEKDIKDYYDQRFIAIRDTGGIQHLKETHPSGFAELFTAGDLQKMTEKLVWVKIVFPAAMQQENLNDIYIYLNAFPVVNRQVNDLKYRLKGGSNIMPLRTDTLEQFLSVKSLSDETRQYTAVPYRKMEEGASGTYTLRNGGVERFDDRNARELISYLLELLRSESAAFAAYGYDFVATTLKEMNQKISLMEQKTKGYINNAAEIPHYIIVKPFEGQDLLYAEYWTTLAEVANNLRSGTRMEQAKGVKIKQGGISLITTTTGGKNRLRPEERVNAFRYGISTRNRIITKEDIRNFCFYELGDRISKVDVERGFELSEHSRETFRRTIDVTLTPSEMRSLESETWQTICEQLKSKLQTRSGMSNHYRIVLNDAES